ncbi:hypothetical protein M758_6G066100 [Ceratodon purpureus]|nr:hypothetical protein M758_6G066100 [Ceratodon purpureus]
MGTSESKLTENAGTPERCLGLTKECLERAQKRTSLPTRSISPKFHFKQCEYLVDKLRLAVEGADSFLLLLNAEYAGFPSTEHSANCLESFKLLYALSREVESFTQNCCKDTWIQAALTMTNVSELVSSVGFNLELWRIAFGTRQRLTLTEVDGVYDTEVQSVKEKALSDVRTISTSLNAVLRSGKSSISEQQLAAFILDRLHKRSTESSQSSLSEAVLNLRHGDLHQVGKGASATVYRWTWLGAELVVKTFYGGDNKDFSKEVSVLKELSHPNIITILCFAKGDSKCSIVMEKMDEDLDSLIQKRKESRGPNEPPFCLLEAIDIMLQIGGGMQYLHESRIAHRDLKSLNVLVKCVKAASDWEIEYVRAKVADFGMSKTKLKSMTFSKQTPNTGTTRWMAPELIKLADSESKEEMSEGETTVEKYPLKCDIYSFAMVCYEILTGKLPFPNISSQREVRRLVLKGERPQLPDGCPDRLKELIHRCWSDDPQKRPAFGDICKELRQLKCLLLTPSVTWADNSIGSSSMTTEDGSNNDYLEHSFSSIDSPPSPGTPTKRPSLFQSLSSMKLRNAVPFLIESGRCFKPLHQQTTLHKDFRSPPGSEIYSSSDCKPFGYLVSQVWSPTKSDASKMDVLFFEGNVGKMKDMSCKETWVQRDKPNVWWPRDWLPKDLGGDIRVLLLEYSISDDGVDGVLEQLETLLVFRDHWNRGRTWERPIVLVGHSLGCVMIEHLVVALDKRAQSSQKLEDETDINRAKMAKAFLTSLAGCFFYAPPWTGLVRDDVVLKHVFGGLSYSTQLFKDLYYSSSELKSLSEDFKRTQISGHMKLMAVTEGYHTMGRPTVVPLESMQNFPGRVVKLSDSNHTDVCKPTDKEHQAYKELLNFFADILKSSKASGRKFATPARNDQMNSARTSLDSAQTFLDSAQTSLDSAQISVDPATDDRQEPQRLGKALYDFTADGDEELNLTAGEELEVVNEVDGWLSVRKIRPGRDGKTQGRVPGFLVSYS